MTIRPHHAPALLPIAAMAAVLVSMDRFVESENRCLFQQGNDLSTAAQRKAYAECMIVEKYYLKQGCEEGATTSACYNPQP
ncbi:hypothetical protein [Rhizobium sp. RAF56]|uniref:hypothetical protein n=1 Tax=Rhizobium sp. RAF56 TaxID=3233062 RepID=UPI003F971D29